MNAATSTSASTGALANASTIRERFGAARGSGKRAREAAEAIGISEGQAIAAHAGSHDGALKAVPLRGPWIDLLQSLELCGPLMALTRNDSTVHEKTGVYRKLSAAGHVGLALGEDIDLRLFFDRWHAGFRVTEPATQPGNPPATSLQFFDPQGVAVHKIYPREATDREAFDAVAAQHADASLEYLFGASQAPAAVRPDREVDTEALAQAWGSMKDTHEFFPLMKKFDVERQQSFRLMEGRFTQRAPTGTLERLLGEAAMDGTPIMVFVGSPGCIQIHTGPVRRVEPMDVPARGGAPAARWLNVLDPGFNLHLREDLIRSVWVVEKPTSDGVVTSVEAFDANGGLMAMFFGARKPGQPELEAWRSIVRRLPVAGALAA